MEIKRYDDKISRALRRVANLTLKKLRKKRKMGGKLESLLGGIDDGNAWEKTYRDGWKPVQSYKKLQPGFYRAEVEPHEGVTLRPSTYIGDEYILLENDPSQAVVEEIKTFWKMREEYNRLGFLWKRGVLLYGPPGTGKSTTIRMVMDFFIQSDGIVISSSDVENIIATCVSIRGPEKNRPILAIMEDIDAFTSDGDSLEALLQFLDGHFQLENIVVIATTNYPELLQDRIINRPGRFDCLVEMPIPTKKDRETYLKHKIKDEEKVKYFVENSDGFSIAHLKEVICASEILKEDPKAVMKRMRKMISEKPKNKTNRKGHEVQDYA